MECETAPLPGPSGAVSPTSCAASVASLGSTGSGNDRVVKHAEMVASLQGRRAQLEAKLAAKNEELKMLCIQEAELTGVLPPEIPLEPGETPPTLRRRVGTSFTLPESLLNKLRSTEEESVAGVELEIKIQTGIAEAALGLANDTSANKQVRRKHRLMYQQSQRRLLELDTKLNLFQQRQDMQSTRSETPTSAQQLKSSHQQEAYQQQLQQQQQQLKHRKKPRPPIECEPDTAEVDGMLHAGGISLSPLGQADLDFREARLSSALTASTNTVGLPLQPLSHRHSSYRYSTIDSSWNVEVERSNRREGMQSGMGSSYWGPSARQEMPSPGSSRLAASRYPSCSPGEVEEAVRPASQRWKRDRAMLAMSRFGSLDRRRAAVNGANAAVTSIDEVESGAPALLPSQTYPEHSLGHSLVRTQSLGSVEAARPRTLHAERDSSRDRKPKEKEWYETSLDAATALSPEVEPVPLPLPLRPPQRVSSAHWSLSVHIPASKPQLPPPPPPPPPPPAPAIPPHGSAAGPAPPLPPHHPPPPQLPPQLPPHPPHHSPHHPALSPRSQSPPPLHVPLESPRNHMVVQAGSWQPYREVTKPFEMSDFYKYSTKFRKQMQQSADSPPTVQQKAAYQPLQPLTCQPLEPGRSESVASPPESLADAFSSEMLAWFQDQRATAAPSGPPPPPRSATLV